MSMLSFALRDTVSLLRRDLQHSLRNVSFVFVLIVPTIMLLLFNYVFGGTIGAGLGRVAHGVAYINYLAPGILIVAVGSGCAATALNLCMDMSEGVITRFRTMAIFRPSVLIGQAVGSLIRTLIGVVLVLGVALLVGFRPTTNPIAWIAALGLIALVTLGITWMGTLFGLVGKTPSGANSLAQLFILLTFISSAYVSPDLMPVGVRWFAEYQPFTPDIDTLRGLLLGTPIDAKSVVLAIAWSLGLTLFGYLGAQAIYNGNPAR
ncbi:MAG TPA: ABC transporter permease [Ktedonobacterales bacterium]|nr:ABC transporter permease [Ktedonobacterales bacterium]